MKTQNTLFPIFIRLDRVSCLIVGGGNVGLEKLEALLKQFPDAHINLVAPSIKDEIFTLKSQHPNLTLHSRPFDIYDLEEKDIVICATDNPILHAEIHSVCKQKHILVNVADTPDLCDFYLSSIAVKGNLKIAISTNGKSPTLAKRLRELFEEVLPENIDTLLDQLQEIRNKLKGDFAYKVKKMDEITKQLKSDSFTNYTH